LVLPDGKHHQNQCDEYFVFHRSDYLIVIYLIQKTMIYDIMIYTAFTISSKVTAKTIIIFQLHKRRVTKKLFSHPLLLV